MENSIRINDIIIISGEYWRVASMHKLLRVVDGCEYIGGKPINEGKHRNAPRLVFRSPSHKKAFVAEIKAIHNDFNESFVSRSMAVSAGVISFDIDEKGVHITW